MKRFAILAAGLSSRAVSDILLLIYLLLSTERALVPWDMWGLLAPPPGHWQRELNVFFNQPPGLYLPAFVALGLGAIFFVRGMLRLVASPIRYWLPFVFAGLNLVFLVIGFLSIPLLNALPDLWLPQPRPPVDVGYHRTWPGILVTSILLVLLLWGQSQSVSPERWEKLAERN